MQVCDQELSWLVSCYRHANTGVVTEAVNLFLFKKTFYSFR